MKSYRDKNDFEVSIISNNEINLYNYRQNVTYFLVGYQVNTFDYDKLFYENIEYFLQEFIAWEKLTTQGGVPNAFDSENYLAFTPENNTTFYSSQDNFGTHVDILRWSYVGDYEVFDVAGFEDVKILTLYYEGEDIEEFELTVVNDDSIRLFNLNSQTTYDFRGRGFVQFLKGTKTKKDTTLIDLVLNGRNQNISTCILSQSDKLISKNVRKNIKFVILLRQTSPESVESNVITFMLRFIKTPKLSRDDRIQFLFQFLLEHTQDYTGLVLNYDGKNDDEKIKTIKAHL